MGGSRAAKDMTTWVRVFEFFETWSVNLEEVMSSRPKVLCLPDCTLTPKLCKCESRAQERRCGYDHV